MSPKLKSTLAVGLPLLAIIVFSYFFQTTFLSNQEQFTTWLRSFGPFIILAYIILQWLTIIIAPIGGLFLFITILGIFGPFWGYIIGYLVSTPAYCVNFLLSKKFGRNLVIKIIGEGPMKKIDHYIADAGTISLFVLKIFMGGYFDFISYVIGLTKTSFRTFLLVNFVGGIPGSVVSYFIFTRFSNFTQSIIAILVVSYVFIGIAILINHWREKRRKN